MSHRRCGKGQPERFAAHVQHFGSIDGLRLKDGRTYQAKSESCTKASGSGYFNTLGIPLRVGRDFSELDRFDAPRVAIINEALAQKFWGQTNPAGMRLVGGDAPITVVGVVGNTHHFSLETPAEPKLYLPYSQSNLQWWMFVVVRSSANVPDLPDRLRHELQSMDATLFVSQPTLLQNALRSTMADRHEMLVLIGSFAFLALVLTTSGLYGMLANFAAQRTHEIGIRMALGAQASNLMGTIMRQAVQVALIGLAAGTVVSFSFSHYLSSQLFGVTQNDSMTYAGVAILFLLVAAMAAYLPARRATKVDPIVALRYE